jgi:hypothetical protein
LSGAVMLRLLASTTCFYHVRRRMRERQRRLFGPSGFRIADGYDWKD